MLSKKFMLTLAGAAGAIASGIAIADAIVEKTSHRKNADLLLAGGITGLVASSALIAFAQLTQEEEEQEYEDMLSDEDIALMDTNISEVLSNSAEQPATTDTLQAIEVDEEASIEDFI